MAINPLLVTIKQASDLPIGVPTGDGYFFYWEGNTLMKSDWGNVIEQVAAGWTVQTAYEADGDRLVRKITGYTGGVGTLPTVLADSIGKYYKDDGTLTTVKADGADFKGAPGTAGTNGKTIETWSAKSFVTGSQVFHLGKIWENTAPTVAGDVPGTAAVWVEKLGTVKLDVAGGAASYDSINNNAKIVRGTERVGIEGFIQFEQGNNRVSGSTGGFLTTVGYTRTDYILLRAGDTLTAYMYPKLASGFWTFGYLYNASKVYKNAIPGIPITDSSKLTKITYTATVDEYVILAADSTKENNYFYDKPADVALPIFLTPADVGVTVASQEDLENISVDEIQGIKYINGSQYTLQAGDSKYLLLFTAKDVTVFVPSLYAELYKTIKGQFLGNGVCVVKANESIYLNIPKDSLNIVNPNGQFEVMYSDPQISNLSGDLVGISDTFRVEKPTDLTNIQSVLSTLTGKLTTTGFDLKARLSAAGTQYVTVYSDAARTNVVTHSPLSTADIYNNVHCEVRGLTAGTKYYWKIGTFEGEVTTAPLNSTFQILLGACGHGPGTDDWFSNHEVYGYMADNHKDALFLFHMGDLHYKDYGGTDPTLHLQPIEDAITTPNQSKLYRQMPLVYMFDDHDYLGNDSGGDRTGKFAHRVSYKSRFPHYDFAFSERWNLVAHTFAIGKVRFINFDERNNRLNGSQIVGSSQLKWLENILLNSNEDLFIINTGVNFIGTSSEGWNVSATERQQIIDMINNNGLTNNVLLVAGDAHMLAYDDGTNNYGIPVIHAASFDSDGSIKGGPYSSGTFPARGQYGAMDFVDNAGSISMSFKGYRVVSGVRTEILTFSKSFPKLNRTTKKSFPRPQSYIQNDTLLPELQTVLNDAAITNRRTPAPTVLTAINTMISEMIGLGIWAKMENFLVFAFNQADNDLLKDFGFYDLVNAKRFAPHTTFTTSAAGGALLNSTIRNHSTTATMERFKWNNSSLGIVTYPSDDILTYAASDSESYIYSEPILYILSTREGRILPVTGATPLPDKISRKPKGITVAARQSSTNINYYNGDWYKKTHNALVEPAVARINVGRTGFSTTVPLSCFFTASYLTTAEVEGFEKIFNKYLLTIGLKSIL